MYFNLPGVIVEDYSNSSGREEKFQYFDLTACFHLFCVLTYEQKWKDSVFLRTTCVTTQMEARASDIGQNCAFISSAPSAVIGLQNTERGQTAWRTCNTEIIIDTKAQQHTKASETTENQLKAETGSKLQQYC